MNVLTIKALEEMMDLMRPKVSLSDANDTSLLRQIYLRVSSLYCQLTVNRVHARPAETNT